MYNKFPSIPEGGTTTAVKEEAPQSTASEPDGEGGEDGTVTAPNTSQLLFDSLPKEYKDLRGEGGPVSPSLPPPSQASGDGRSRSGDHCRWLLPPWPPPQNS